MFSLDKWSPGTAVCETPSFSETERLPQHETTRGIKDKELVRGGVGEIPKELYPFLEFLFRGEVGEKGNEISLSGRKAEYPEVHAKERREEFPLDGFPGEGNPCKDLDVLFSRGDGEQAVYPFPQYSLTGDPGYLGECVVYIGYGVIGALTLAVNENLTVYIGTGQGPDDLFEKLPAAFRFAVHKPPYFR